MAFKRRFKEDDFYKLSQSDLNENCKNSQSNNEQEIKYCKKFLRDKEFNSTISNNVEVEPNLSNEIKFTVKNLVNELITVTDKDLDENSDQHNGLLDDSLKLNYDFNNSLMNNNVLLNCSSQFENSFDSTSNCQNVPTTSSSSNQSFNHSNELNKKIKGALKISNALKNVNKKNVKFQGVTVFYFPRNQGFTCVPSQGGSTLGMELNHSDTKDFSLDAHQEEKRQVHKEILLRQKRYEKMCQKQQARTSNSNQSDSEEDALENISDISDSELEFDSWYFLQPVPIKQRRALLRESGVNKIDSLEKEECREIRVSREYCGCECRIYCDPETCQCSLAGIKCQVDRSSFPCGCSRESCGNLNGRIEFNPLRVRTHFIHTIMRLELEKKNDSQHFNEETPVPSSSTEKSKDSIKSALFLVPNQQDSKFASTQLMQNYVNEVNVNSSNANELNSNELNLDSENYNVVYSDSSDSGSSYSENSDCTSEELDCRLTTAAENQTLNSTGFPLHLSPFSLINSNQTNLNNDLINNGNYENREQNYHSSRTFMKELAFRFATNVSSNNEDQNENSSTNEQISNLHFPNYYHQESVYSNSLTNCYSNQQHTNNIENKSNSNNENNIYNNDQNFETHYTDLSQSIVSSKSTESTNDLLSVAYIVKDINSVCSVLINSNNDNEFNVNCQHLASNNVVNSDDSSSGQSLNSNCTNLENFSANGDSSQNEICEEQDNFGEIIKNTIVESVTA